MALGYKVGDGRYCNFMIEERKKNYFVDGRLGDAHGIHVTQLPSHSDEADSKSKCC